MLALVNMVSMHVLHNLFKKIVTLQVSYNPCLENRFFIGYLISKNNKANPIQGFALLFPSL
jgi:hypothetical protein